MSVFDADRLTAEAGRESAMTEAVSTLRSGTPP
jgi:hypothetical protein